MNEDTRSVGVNHEECKRALGVAEQKIKRLKNIVAETKLCMKNIVNEESQYAYRKVIMGNGIAHCTDILAMIEALDRDTGKEG